MNKRLHLAVVAASFSTTAFAAVPLDTCNSTGFQEVLQANGEQLDARAVWLDARLVRWPGAAADGTYRLYHSPTGAIVAKAGGKVVGAAGSLKLDISTTAVPQAAAERFKWVATGPTLRVADTDVARLPALHREQLVLVQEDASGAVLASTRIQSAGALDALYAAAEGIPDLGATPTANKTDFKLWAPTARQVALCTYDGATSKASAVHALKLDDKTGAWATSLPRDLSGSYYKYAVDVVVPGAGLVRNLVTDPYSVSLNADSQRSYVADLDAANLKPAGWDATRPPATVQAQTDMVIYELHVRDFSLIDQTVPAARRGKYGAFSETESNGMRHLRALAKAGLTDVHLLPVYDIGSIPEVACAQPQPGGAPDAESQQALIRKTAHTDCFNWGYDPQHFNAVEGSYASDPQDGAKRIVEFRQMVMDLHKAGLRVGTDVVYNHTFIAGQEEKSILDRVVPGYYHRLDAKGAIETSTCCFNTATENTMMAKLMIDSSVLWTRHYKIDSYRFDLMGHQPRAVMERLQREVDQAAGRHVQLIGEGWNFGEVADGARFVQASQLSLNGTGIGTFSDRGRDAVRGGSPGDSGEIVIRQQGYINGLVYDPNALGHEHAPDSLLRAADLIRVGLAGSVRSYPMQTLDGKVRQLQDIVYGGNQPAGYASQPAEAVNYVENHDNQTLYDINALKLPLATSAAERARVQVLGMAINAFSQGVAYYHAGIDVLRSKSLDRNSFNSGDWFNRLDWTYQDNFFGTGLPPSDDNAKDWPLFKPLLANAALKPAPADIAFARDAFRDLLSIRASSTLLRMRTTEDINRRLRFFNTGPEQVPTVLAAWIDGQGYPGANFAGLGYLVNVDKKAHVIKDEALRGKKLRLHPAHTATGAADKRALEARFDSASGTFTVPARTAVVFVAE